MVFVKLSASTIDGLCKKYEIIFNKEFEKRVNERKNKLLNRKYFRFTSDKIDDIIKKDRPKIKNKLIKILGKEYEIYNSLSIISKVCLSSDFVTISIEEAKFIRKMQLIKLN